MTRLERRAAMPECTAFIDAMREDFPGLTVLYADENGVTWGEPRVESEWEGPCVLSKKVIEGMRFARVRPL